MNAWFEPFTTVVLLTIFSVLAGYLYARMGGARRRHNTRHLARVRVRLPGGMAHGVLQAVSASGWMVGPILQRQGSPIPAPGDLVTVEAPDERGVTLFRSSILSIEGTSMILSAPTDAVHKERRGNRRRTDVSSWPTSVDGQEGLLLDISSLGAKLAGVHCPKGERVQVTIGSMSLPAWVLESGEHTRVLFEEPLDPRSLKSKTAPF